MTMKINVSKNQNAFGFGRKERWIEFRLHILAILQNVADGLNGKLILINDSNSEATMQYL